MSEGANGIIYICPPTGYTIYTLDPSTDEVTSKTIAMLDLSRPSNNPQQTGIFFDPDTGDASFLSASLPEYFALSIKPVDSESCKIPFRTEEWSFDRELEGGYTCLNTVQDGGRGLYIIGTRRIRQSELGGKLEYEGFTQYADDSVMLFYIPDLSDTESKTVKCADVEPPCEERGSEGIWQLVRVKDAKICSDGTLNIIYCSCLADLDDADRRSYGEFTSSTLKHYLAVFNGTELISKT